MNLIPEGMAHPFEQSSSSFLKYRATIQGNGAPGRIRTPDPLIRSQVLYPAELPVLLKIFG